MLRRAFAPLWLASVFLSFLSADIEAQGTSATRITTASELASSLYSQWLGPTELPTVINTMPSPFDRAGSMSLESAVAFEMARDRFGHFASDNGAVADGIAWYLQSRVVERAFDVSFRAPGYRLESTCFFGCYVRWTFPSLIVGRWADGLGRVEYLRHHSGREWPLVDRRPAARLEGRALGIALALASLERELGWPTLQGALRVAANAQDGRPFVEILEQATARHLTTVFAVAARASADPRLESVTSVPATTCGTTPCYVTRVTFVGGDQIPFPLSVLVEFDDNTRLLERWDGAVDAFEFESAAAATRVRLDPDRHSLLDADFANGEYVRAPRAGVRVTKWVSAWILWLQDAMLTSTFPL